MFEVLADPTRRRIVELLRDGPRTVGELTSALGASQPATSKHLRVLRESAFVRVEAVGQQRRYELRPEPLEAIDAWLAPFRAYWEHRLDALEAHLDREDR